MLLSWVRPIVNSELLSGNIYEGSDKDLLGLEMRYCSNEVLFLS
jgi:hypothetical protein